jgi:cysteine desulfurase
VSGGARDRRVYLDWNATTPPLPEVVEAMAVAAREAWGNPSSTHATGRAARAVVEDARQAVADLAGCDPRDVTFTSGGTEANNLALRGAFGAPGCLITSRMEHPSVAKVAEALAREGRATVRWVAVRPDGVLHTEDFARALAEGPARLATVQAVNPETGVVQPVAEVLRLAGEAGVAVHVDAVQAWGRGVDVARGADTRSLAGHKIRGPKAIGALIARRASALQPVLVGGSQERGLRPGTLDPVAAAGLAVAARHARTSGARWEALAPLRDRLERGLVGSWRRARVNGAGAPRAPHLTNVAFPGWRGPELVAALDLEGVAASSGSACSAGTAEPSPVLLAMGDAEAAESSVRFSLGEDTCAQDIDFALEAIARVLRRGP